MSRKLHSRSKAIEQPERGNGQSRDWSASNVKRKRQSYATNDDSRCANYTTPRRPPTTATAQTGAAAANQGVIAAGRGAGGIGALTASSHKRGTLAPYEQQQSPVPNHTAR